MTPDISTSLKYYHIKLELDPCKRAQGRAEDRKRIVHGGTVSADRRL